MRMRNSTLPNLEPVRGLIVEFRIPPTKLTFPSSPALRVCASFDQVHSIALLGLKLLFSGFGL